MSETQTITRFLGDRKNLALGVSLGLGRDRDCSMLINSPTAFAYILTDPKGGGLTTMAWLSIQTLRRFHPDAKVIIWTDVESQESFDSLPWRSFADCEVRTCRADGDSPMMRSRWLKSRLIQLMNCDFVFLDCDTLILRDLSELLAFDGEFAVAMDANKAEKPLMTEPGLRAFFERVQWPVGDTPDYNSGVWIARRSAAVAKLGNIWPQLWTRGLEEGVVMDQPSFWSALYQAEVRVTTLAAKWNALVVHNPKIMREAHIAHFWQSHSVGGTLLEELIVYAHRCEKVHWGAIERATRLGLPWKRDAEPWQYVKSGRIGRAILAKTARWWSRWFPGKGVVDR